ESVRRMIRIFVSEGYAAHHTSIFTQPEERPYELGMHCERTLRDRAHAETLRRQHEVADPGATVDRAVDAERLISRDDRDVRSAEQTEVLAFLALPAF